MQLNFTIKELCASSTATRLGISNTPSIAVSDNLMLLIVNVLQPLRNRFGAITVTSGYRNNKLNMAVNGSPSSNHLRGCAADIVPQKATFKQIYDFITQNLDYDECFIETNKQGTKWLHIAFRKENNRKKHNPNYLA